MSRSTAFFTDERCFWHSGGSYALVLPVGGWVQPPSAAGFAESPESKRRFRNLLEVSALPQYLSMRTAPLASDEDMLRVHTADYLQRLKAFSDSGGGKFGIEAAVGPGSYEIARQSAGLAIAAVDAVLSGEVDNAYSLSRPPGHHCLPEEAMGFCLLANIPIAIEAAKARHGLKRVAIVDWDVHHGNGTQHIFYDRNDVLTISLHQENCFPAGYSGLHDRGVGEGEGYNYNIPLPAGSDHETYLQAIDQIVVPAFERFQPDIIIVACGFDANALDPLARMQLHSDSYRAMTRRMREAAEKLCNGHLVMVHEGGYSEAYVPFCGVAVVEELSGVDSEVVDPAKEFIKCQIPDRETAEFLHKRVDQLTDFFSIE